MTAAARPDVGFGPPLADTLALMMPDAPVVLLLRAALLDANAAGEAWNTWRRDTADPKAFLAADRVGIKRHLPLLYRNLSRHGLDIGRELEPYFRAARAREELRSTRYRQYLGEAIDALHGAEIGFILGKGVTVGETIHDDPVLRHSHDIDLLVRSADLPAAGEALRAAGFEHSRKAGPRDEPRYDHESGLPVELHDRLYRTPFYQGTLNDAWFRARGATILDRSVRVLDDATLLVQTPAHASVVPQRYGLSWIVDAVTLLQKRDTIDWPEVLEVAREHRVALPLFAAYRHLAQEYEASIPSNTIDQLRNEASRADRLRHLAVIDGLRVGPNDRIKPLWQASSGGSRGAIIRAMLLPPPAYFKARFPDAGPIRRGLLYAIRPLWFAFQQINKARYRLICRLFGDPATRARRAFERRLQPEERLLLGCLCQEISAEDANAISRDLRGVAIDWQLVEDNAREQGVAPLMFSNLKRCRAAGLDVPPMVLNRFRGAMFTAIKTKEEHGRWLTHVLTYINSQNLDVMLVKGAALDLEVLKTPWHVVSLDVDLLVREHYSDLPEEVCEPIWDFNSQGPLECDFGTHHDLSIDELLPIDYTRLWADAKRVDLDGRSAWVMSPEDMLVTACTDACRKRFFHLKNLFNLRAILDRFDNLDWDRVATIAQAQRCTGIVYAALWSARLATGAEVGADLLPWLRLRWRGRLIRWLAARRSFTPVTRRSVVRQKDFSLINKRVFEFSNLSLLLVYTAYSPRQVWHRLRWLSRKPEANKPGMFTQKHAERARKSVDTPPAVNSPNNARDASTLEAHGS